LHVSDFLRVEAAALHDVWTSREQEIISPSNRNKEALVERPQLAFRKSLGIPNDESIGGC